MGAKEPHVAFLALTDHPLLPLLSSPVRMPGRGMLQLAPLSDRQKRGCWVFCGVQQLSQLSASTAREIKESRFPPAPPGTAAGPAPVQKC